MALKMVDYQVVLARLDAQGKHASKPALDPPALRL